jgi:(R,R)-butanediol dehydrogenase/meso-butanediol dehydrogenase/diacetyl reductase
MRRMLNIHEVGDVRLDRIALPEPGAGDVVVDVQACGICGSDLSYIKMGGIYRQPGGVTPIGHEAAGTVSYVGAEVSGVELGQRVIINPMMTPSAIGSGGPEGAFTDQVMVAQAQLGQNLLDIPEGIPFEIAALAEPLAVAMHGVNRANLQPGESVVVFGCGPIGLGMLLWLADRGFTQTVAVDISDERLERARQLGVLATVNPLQENLTERLKALHGTGKVFSRETVGTDVYIDAAGAPNILSDVIGMANYQSRMVVTAAYMKPVEMPLGTMLTTEMALTTAVGYPTEMPEVIAAMPRLQGVMASLISHHFHLDDVVAALGVAATPASAKVMIDIR